MKPIPSADGLAVNWVNYKTGVKHISFKMNAEQQKTTIAIEITHPDAEVRKRYFEQFIAFKLLLDEALGEEWDWNIHAISDFGLPFGQIIKTLPGISIYSPQNWPALISFLKPRIMALDEFWSNVKPVFEAL